jgi:hypothetical protein
MDNETVPGKEDERSIVVQDPADEEKAGWWRPAVAGDGEGSMSAATKTARGQWRQG